MDIYILNSFRIISPAFYLISAIFYWLDFVQENQIYRLRGKRFETTAIGVHTFYLIYLTFFTGHLPLADLYQALTTFMWFFALLNRLLIREDKKYSFGIFSMTLLFIFQTISMILIDFDSQMPQILLDVYFEIHVLFNLVAYASFSTAFFAAVMYVLLFHEIKGNRLGFFYERIPSLSYLEKLNYRALLVGFTFNTIGIITASLTGKTAWGIYWAWDPKLISVAFAYLVYGFTLFGKLRLKWPGTKIAYWSIVAYLWIIFSMLIINNFFTKLHSFN